MRLDNWPAFALIGVCGLGALAAGAGLVATTGSAADVATIVAPPASATTVLQRNAPAARPDPARHPAYTGVAIGAGGFASKRIPGRFGYDYMYPSAKEAAPFVAGGMNVVRVPVLWERLQPAAFAPLDRVEMQRLDAALGNLRGFKMVLLDIHNYGTYRGVRLDQAERGSAMLADLWTRLAAHFRTDPRMAFALMNEPHGMTAAAWRTIAEASLLAIRATGARNLVLVPGTNWSAAYSWNGGPGSNGAAMAGLRDPANNMAFEFHQYADNDSSGLHAACIAPANAAARLAPATQWLRAQHSRGFLGEFGAGPDTACLAALDAMLTAMDKGSDVWLGWTYWAAGAMWGNYPMNIMPDANGARPQYGILSKHLAR